MVTQAGSALWLALAGCHLRRVTAVISKAKVVGGQSTVVLSKQHRGARKLHERQTSSYITWRGYRATAHGDRCPQCCLSFVSVAHAVVLENAGTRGLYTKPCFSSRLYSLVLKVRAPESREGGAQHGANHLKTAGVVTLIAKDKVGGICR